MAGDDGTYTELSLDAVLNLHDTFLGTYTIEGKRYLIAHSRGSGSDSYAAVDSHDTPAVPCIAKFEPFVNAASLGEAFDDLLATYRSIPAALTAASGWLYQYFLWFSIMHASLGLIWEPLFAALNSQRINDLNAATSNGVFETGRFWLSIMLPFFSYVTIFRVFSLSFPHNESTAFASPIDVWTDLRARWVKWPRWKREICLRPNKVPFFFLISFMAMFALAVLANSLVLNGVMNDVAPVPEEPWDLYKRRLISYTTGGLSLMLGEWAACLHSRKSREKQGSTKGVV